MYTTEAIAVVTLILAVSPPALGSKVKGSDCAGKLPAVFEEKIKAFKEVLSKYEKKVTSLEGFIKEQETEIQQLKIAMKEEKQINNNQDRKLTHLATPQHFSVYLSSDRNVSAGQVLVFDGVEDDPMGLYDRTQGAFTCRVAGVYTFTLTAFTTGKSANTRLTLAMFVHGQRMGSVHALGNNDQGSNTASVALKAGDVVKVKGVWRPSVVRGDSNQYTTFVGTLVTPTL